MFELDFEPVHKCECCGEGICKREKYIKINGKHYHQECILDNYSNAELLEMFGVKIEIA